MTRKKNLRKLRKTLKKVRNILQGGSSVPAVHDFQGETQTFPKKNVCVVKLHGCYFKPDGSPEVDDNYFNLPPNITICNLTEISNYSSSDFSTQFQITQSQKDMELFELMFKFYGNLSNYDLIDAISKKKINDKFYFENIFDENLFFNQASDLFYNASWFYHGQRCHNAYFEANRSDIFESGLNITDYQLESGSLKTDYQTVNVRAEFREPKYNITLEELCKKLDPSYQHIVLTLSCMFYPTEKKNKYLYVKESDSRQTQNNREISMPVDQTYKNQLSEWKSPKYYFYNKMNLIDINEELHNIAQLYPLETTIQEYDKRYRILEKIINDKIYLQLTARHNKSYLNFLRSLTFSEVINYLKKSSKLEETQQLEILKIVFDDVHFKRSFYNFQYLLCQVVNRYSTYFQEGSSLYQYIMSKILDFEILEQTGLLVKPEYQVIFNYIRNYPEPSTVITIKSHTLEPLVEYTPEAKNKILIIEGNNISQIRPDFFQFYPHLQHLKFMNVKVVNKFLLQKINLPSPHIKKGYTLKFFNCGISDHQIISLFQEMSILNMYKCKIPDLKIPLVFSHLSELEISRCEVNHIIISKNIDRVIIKDCYKLRRMELSKNHIRTLHLTNLPLIYDLNFLTQSQQVTINELHLNSLNLTYGKEINDIDIKNLSLHHVTFLNKFTFLNPKVSMVAFQNIPSELDFNQLYQCAKLISLEINSCPLLSTIEEPLDKLSLFLGQIGLSVINSSPHLVKLISNNF